MPRHTTDSTTQKQTIEDFLASGGQITKCPATRALSCAPGTAVIDGATYAEYLGVQEIVPRHTLTAAAYTRAIREHDHDPEPIPPMASHAWRDIEDEATRAYIPAIPTFDTDDEF